MEIANTTLVGSRSTPPAQRPMKLAEKWQPRKAGVSSISPPRAGSNPMNTMASAPSLSTKPTTTTTARNPRIPCPLCIRAAWVWASDVNTLLRSQPNQHKYHEKIHQLRPPRSHRPVSPRNASGLRWTVRSNGRHCLLASLVTQLCRCYLSHRTGQAGGQSPSPLVLSPPRMLTPC